MQTQLASPSFAYKLPFTAPGLVLPDPTTPLSRFQLADVACAMILEHEGKPEGARFIIDRLERDLGVTEHDRLVADHGYDVIAGAHCALNRPRRAKLRARKPSVDPAVFTAEDLRQVAKAQRKIASPDEDTRLRGHQDLQAIVDRRHSRIMTARSTVASDETLALSKLRDGSVEQLRSGRLRRVDGLELLHRTKAIGAYGLQSARRYGELYASTQPRSGFKSCLAAVEGRTDGIIDLRSPAEQAEAELRARHRAEDRLEARSYIERILVRATNARALLLLQQVAGEGASIASLATSGPMRTVFRREVIAAIGALEAIYSGDRPDLIDRPVEAPC